MGSRVSSISVRPQPCIFAMMSICFFIFHLTVQVRMTSLWVRHKRHQRTQRAPTLLFSFLLPPRIPPPLLHVYNQLSAPSPSLLSSSVSCVKLFLSVSVFVMLLLFAPSPHPCITKVSPPPFYLFFFDIFFMSSVFFFSFFLIFCISCCSPLRRFCYIL